MPHFCHYLRTRSRRCESSWARPTLGELDMKKIALAAFSATALLALSACGGNDEAAAPEATDTAAVEEVAPTDTAVPTDAATDAAATDAATDAAATDAATDAA